MRINCNDVIKIANIWQIREHCFANLSSLTFQLVKKRFISSLDTLGANNLIYNNSQLKSHSISYFELGFPGGFGKEGRDDRSERERNRRRTNAGI